MLLVKYRQKRSKEVMRMKLEKLQSDWETIGEVDALWGVLSSKEKRGEKWDIDEFYQSGVAEVNSLMDRVKALGIQVKSGNALDFGCGAGRLTQALTAFFRHCHGVDISAPMINIAIKNNRFGDKVSYTVNQIENLGLFSDNLFDFIYSTITLQHMETRQAELYIKEFTRVMKPGGLLTFQMISCLPLLNRLQPKRRLYALLRAIWFPPRILFYTLHLAPIRMNAIPESELVGILSKSGCKVAQIDRTKLPSGIISSVYFVTKNV
jgi:ubiquinone/menaquinone biosynthesis C-methylase UbiE